MSAAVTFAVPLPKKPLTKLATAASSSSPWPRANGGMKARSTGDGAFEPASRIAVRLDAAARRRRNIIPRGRVLRDGGGGFDRPDAAQVSHDGVDVVGCRVAQAV